MVMKNKKEVIKFLRLIIVMIFSAFMGYLIGKYLLVGVSQSNVSPMVMLSVLVPIFIFVIGWHEGGHALAGIKVGFDFKMYVVGLFMWEKENGKWVFKWNKDVNKAGGLVLCLPRDTTDLSKKFSIYAAAGPLSSLFLSILLFGIYGLGLIPAEQETMKFIFVVTAFLSLLIFIVTAIPSKMGGFYSDGARVLRILRGGDTAKFEILMMSIIASTSSGVRPKLLNMSQLEEMEEIAVRLNEPFRVYIHSFFYQVALDNADYVKAERHLSDYINQADEIPEGIRNSVWLDAAFFYAYVKKDINEADRYWQKFKPVAMIPKAQIFATEAVLSYIKGDSEMALAKIESSLVEIPNMIDKGVGVALRERLMALKITLENQI